MKKVAITGGLATGKSTTLNIIGDMGYKVFNCDEIVNYLYKKEYIIKKLNFYFGDILISGNMIDKKKIIKNIIPNQKYKSIFNNIFYPILREEITNICNNNLNDNIIFFEIPLLYEVGFQDLFEKVILVYSNKTTQLYRSMFKKGYNFDDVNILLNNQIPMSHKIFISDYIIVSSSQVNYLRNQIQNIIGKI